jgi:hypothetical protein
MQENDSSKPKPNLNQIYEEHDQELSVGYLDQQWNSALPAWHVQK